MRILKTFPLGGIHLNKHKLSANAPIEDLELPEFVNIPVKQHNGSPAKILVEKGSKVKTGTLIAAADGIFSANVHSSVSGEVVKIEDVESKAGWLEQVITIKVEGDEWEPAIDRSPDIKTDIDMTAEEIVETVRGAGIVGMGGSGFPTPIKITVPEGRKAEYLLINGIECEPYLTADGRLMVEKAEQIIIGAKILNKTLGIQNAVICIDENKPEAIKILTQISKRYVGVNVQACASKYPQGGERQLIAAITGREVPSGKLPIETGCIVQNVGTVHAVYEAVMKHKPLFERIVTLSGDHISHPANYRVRVGTPASFILQKGGVDFSRIGKLVLGGPMMGSASVTLDTPVTKLTSGLLVIEGAEAFKPQESCCIRCGKCAEICPVGLLPYAISSDLRNNETGNLKKLHVADCVECGSCAYTCPAKIPLLDYCKLGKYELKKQK